jgi:hypothetical protein
MEQETKICNKCGEEKPLSEFYKQKRKDGSYVINPCKECKAIYTYDNYIKNHDKRLEYARIYQRNNQEKILEYRKKNKDIIKLRSKEYYNEHRAEIAIRHKNYVKKYLKEINKKYSEWRLNNYDKIAEYRKINHKKIIKRQRELREERRIKFIKICKYCGSSFFTTYNSKEYCSKECSHKGLEITSKNWIKTHPRRIKEYRKEYREKYYDRLSERDKNIVKNLPYMYIKKIIKRANPELDISKHPEIIEQRRTIIKAKRLIKQLKQKENATS